MPRPPLPDERIKLLKEEKLFEGKFFDVDKQDLLLPSGLEQSWEIVTHPGATAVLALDETGRILLVEQYRAAVGTWTLEIPAGRLESGEEPLSCAQRELEEETGYQAGSWEHLRTFLPAAGFCSELIHLFLAQDLKRVPGGGLECDPDEELEVQWRTPQEVLALEPADSKTLLATLLFCRERGS